MKKPGYKIKYILLLCALPIVLWLTWTLSFSQTLETYKELKQLEKSALLYPNPAQSLLNLQNELSQIRAVGPGDHLTIDDRLMSTISENLEHFKVELEEFPETHSYVSDNYRVQTFRIRLSGCFGNLLRFINFMEYELSSCKIVSLDFQRELHRKKGERLYLNLSFQSVFNTRMDEKEVN